MALERAEREKERLEQLLRQEKMKTDQLQVLSASVAEIKIYTACSSWSWEI